MTLSSLALTACAPFKGFQGPPRVCGAHATQVEALGNDRFVPIDIVARWWETLEDDQLNRLIVCSLENNQDVTIAVANVLEARGIAREVRWDRYPTVTSRGSVNHVRTSGEIGTGDSTVGYDVDVGFDAEWEIDLFRRVSQGIKAVDARAQAAEASLRDVYVTIASEVARTYIELRGGQHRLAIAKRNTDIQTETYQITKKLADGGRGTQLDVSRAQTQLELTRSTIPTLEAEVIAAIHRLSVLTGQVPDALRSELTPSKAIPSIPQVIYVGDVSSLLRRRPDILAAEKNLQAAIADYNVSVADQFPRVNIVGALGFAATNFSRLGASAIAASLGPTVNWSAFDMGRVRARIHQNDARAQAAVANYEKTVLEALRDLQTAVSDFSKEEVRRGQLQKAASSSKEAVDIARKRYEAGVDTFIDLLNAEATLLQSEDTLALSEINTVVDLIAIYKALGGGWEICNICCEPSLR